MDTLGKQDLIAQIASLELEEQQVSARRRKLHDRIAIFPNVSSVDQVWVTRRQRTRAIKVREIRDALQQVERELSDYRRDLYRRIHAAHAELATLRNAERRARESAALGLN
jgi:hypothetical protein